MTVIVMVLPTLVAAHYNSSLIFCLVGSTQYMVVMFVSIRCIFFFTEEPSPVVPSNQTAVPGSSVSLYCITNGKASNTWYKDGQILGSMSSWAVFGHLREVLVLSNVTMEMEGEYSCVDDDNTIMIAKLNVLSKHTYIKELCKAIYMLMSSYDDSLLFRNDHRLS